MTSSGSQRPSLEGDGTAHARVPLVLKLAVACAILLFAFVQFRHLSHPLLWNDEAYTAVYAERVLEYGYPKVHGARNVVYALDVPLEVGVKEGNDAYVGSPWGQYYLATLGVLAARSVDDPYAKTALLRLPFAIFGVLGLVFFALAIVPLSEVRRDRWRAALAFAVLSLASTSLILHLRELRYYALVVMLGGLIVLLFRKRELSGSIGRRSYGLLLCASLLGLFACYYPAFGAFGIALAIHAFARAVKDDSGRALANLALRLVPLLAAVALAAPLALYWEVPTVIAALQAGWDPSLGAYLRNLGVVCSNLLRFEFLAPVLVARVLVASSALAAHPRRGDAALRERSALAHFLTGLAVVYVLVVARTPFIFERYFVVLSPILSSLLVLDATSLIQWARRESSAEASGVALRDGTVRRVGLALVVAATLGSLALRTPELRGQVRELREPVKGPLDFAIPFLRERYPHPRGLVIATNYEGPALMYYLGCQVIVGYNGPALERDRKLLPDVIVPRAWSRHKQELRAFLEAAHYERTIFPVYDSLVNNIPALSAHTPGGIRHRFQTRHANSSEEAFAILLRGGVAKPSSPGENQSP